MLSLKNILSKTSNSFNKFTSSKTKYLFKNFQSKQQLTNFIIRQNIRTSFFYQTKLSNPHFYNKIKDKAENENKILENVDNFVERHIGPDIKEQESMLQIINLKDLENLVSLAVPKDILLKSPISLRSPISETEVLKESWSLASENKVWRSFIGMGFNGCHVPPVILRNVFENPGWYTQYTPYQAEVSQGRLESLVNFQTMITEMTSMEIANASLLDEATSCAEAVTMAIRHNKKKLVLMDSKCHPQNIEVVKTRAEALGIEVKVMERKAMNFDALDLSAVLVQYPDTEGSLYNLEPFVQGAHKNKALFIVSTDLLALTLLKPPGEYGADIVVGSSQRFGLPLGFGGPHAGFFATKEAFKRIMPGRIVGVTRDSQGGTAYRLALQTREQHIRRDKATSNICTAQALLANMSAMYAVYHGPQRLRKMGERTHRATLLLAKGLESAGHKIIHSNYFDTILVYLSENSELEEVKKRAEKEKINFRFFNDGKIGISLDETVTDDDLNDIFYVFSSTSTVESLEPFQDTNLSNIELGVYKRKSAYLTHPVFNSYHSETKLMRYLKFLENKDVSLCHSMISLGSCTMKLNSAVEMMPCSFEGFSKLHPFVPSSQSEGYLKMINQLEEDLCEITGFSAFSFQSNSGAQGEYSGLRTILAYLKSIGEEKRNVCLIPESAHGTNPASAQMAGMMIEVLKVLKNGDVDLEDLKNKAFKHKDNLAALMITYPSTHGVFDDNIIEICQIIHDHGGQVYLDGANLNAQVGLCRPADFGADVCHLNLHKTFCIPHGGGGPGMGPIGVKKHLAPFVPTHPVIEVKGSSSSSSFGCVNSSPYGSASILPISWAYIRMMGSQNLTMATKVAILNANYMLARLKDHYKILFVNKNGYCAHEFIIDCREFKKSAGVEVVDIAKRLQDYGFHSPTMSFPVAGCLMIEPTESEGKEELDRLCDSLISIKKEIKDIEDGKLDKINNPLKNSPHTFGVATADQWDKPYSRKLAVFPINFVNERNKFWPSIGRIDDTYGDQNFFCSCPPISSYQDNTPEEGK